MIDELTEHTEEADYRFTLDAEGGAIVVRCVVEGAHVQVPAQLGGHPVVALGDESFASAQRGGVTLKVFNGSLERVDLPEGLVRIGRAAFRGCSRLSRVSLPESLEEIDDLAFSCTSVSEIALPRACTRLSQLALRTGPESLAGASSPYFSKLDAIGVDPANPVFCMSGCVLCRRIETGALEAVLCPGKTDELRLGREVERVASTAFAGTYEIGILGLRERLAFADGMGIPSQVSCGVMEIEFDRPIDGCDRLALAMPSRELQRRVFESTAGCDAFDLATFLAAYDAAIVEEPDRLLQAKLAVARLARPVHLRETARTELDRLVTSQLDAICVQFGARCYWQGFDDLANAGLLDAGNIPHAIEVLTMRADATAAAYVLELKRTRFEGSGWDYAL